MAAAKAVLAARKALAIAVVERVQKVDTGGGDYRR